MRPGGVACLIGEGHHSYGISIRYSNYGVPLVFSQASPSPLEAEFSGAMFPVYGERGARNQRLSDSLWIWQFYDASVKAELCSTALETSAGILFVDPVPIAPEPLQDLTRDARIAGVFVTNINHCRAANDFSKKFSCSYFCAGLNTR